MHTALTYAASRRNLGPEVGDDAPVSSAVRHCWPTRGGYRRRRTNHRGPAPVSVSVITDANNVNQKTILYAERVASYIYQGTGLSLSWKKHFPHSIRGWAHASFSNLYER
jgi:hypothetical protein